jgi:hypothetical protein
MKVLNLFFFGLVICLATLSCSKNKGKIKVSGTIQKQGITTYQYGTHTISSYALKSNSIDLDNYINQEVTIYGDKIKGYPVSDGPEFLEVTNIE